MPPALFLTNIFLNILDFWMAEEAKQDPTPTNGADDENAAGDGNNAGSLIDDAKVSSECKMFVGGKKYVIVSVRFLIKS